MIPASFDYHAPGNLKEAVSLLTQHGVNAKILAGGQSLIPAMRFRLSAPGVLIDLNGVEGLDYVRERDGFLAIGAMTREAALEESDVVRTGYPLLADAAKVIADPLVRNRATVGGNVAHADPANDHPAVMLAYGAEIAAYGPGGTRTIPIDEFFVGLFENALRSDEILSEIRIPRPPSHSGGAYIKIERKVGDYAVSAAAIQLTMAGETCATARIALTNVSPTPMRARRAEDALVGAELTDEVLEAAAKAASEDCDPSPDLRGSVAYKRDLTGVLVKRAIRRALERVRA
jgi:carbon-monoxide dehydrogenase medium subunit